MPKCDNIPKRTAQDIFIGGNDILKETKRIIEAKSTIDVLFTDTKRFNAIVHIVPQSFYKICSQIQQNTEATIMNVFVFSMILLNYSCSNRVSRYRNQTSNKQRLSTNRPIQIKGTLHS